MFNINALLKCSFNDSNAIIWIPNEAIFKFLVAPESIRANCQPDPKIDE